MSAGLAVTLGWKPVSQLGSSTETPDPVLVLPGNNPPLTLKQPPPTAFCTFILTLTPSKCTLFPNGALAGPSAHLG